MRILEVVLKNPFPFEFEVLLQFWRFSASICKFLCLFHKFLHFSVNFRVLALKTDFLFLFQLHFWFVFTNLPRFSTPNWLKFTNLTGIEAILSLFDTFRLQKWTFHSHSTVFTEFGSVASNLFCLHSTFKFKAENDANSTLDFHFIRSVIKAKTAANQVSHTSLETLYFIIEIHFDANFEFIKAHWIFLPLTTQFTSNTFIKAS